MPSPHSVAGGEIGAEAGGIGVKVNGGVEASTKINNKFKDTGFGESHDDVLDIVDVAVLFNNLMAEASDPHAWPSTA